MTEFKKKFLSKNTIIVKEEEISTATRLLTQRPLIITDSIDLHQQNNELIAKNNALETQNSNLIERQKKLDTLFMKVEEIAALKLKNKNLKMQKSNVSSELHELLSKEKKIENWNLKNEEFIVDIYDIRVCLTKPKSEKKENYDKITGNRFFIPIHMKIKNLSGDDITIQKCKMDLKKSFKIIYCYKNIFFQIFSFVIKVTIIYH